MDYLPSLVGRRPLGARADLVSSRRGETPSPYLRIAPFKPHDSPADASTQ